MLDPRLDVFLTPRDWFRHAVGRFLEANLAFGHGTHTAVDEAAFLILEALHLPVEALDPFADARLLVEERERLAELIDARVTTRKPAAYLLNKAYIQGVPFYVDERVIVPRSFIGELLFSEIVGEDGLIDAPEEIESVLDLCTGGGSLAILAAGAFPVAHIDATDLSPEALEVAQKNVEMHHLGERIALLQGDLYAPLKKRTYDLILCNPPYVETASLAAFPPEFSAEPRMAHAGGEDGLDIVRRIVEGARARLNPGGALICEVGQARGALEEAYPDLAFTWLDTEEGLSEGEVFFIRAEDLP